MNYVSKIDMGKKMVLVTITTLKDLEHQIQLLKMRLPKQYQKFTSPHLNFCSEIVDRYILALINEGADIIYLKALLKGQTDIDVVYINGYGFPIWRITNASC